MKIILGKIEVEDAIECYLSKQGLNTSVYDLDIKIVVSRSNDDTKIEVDLTKNENEIEQAFPTEPMNRDVEEDRPTTDPFGDR
jgi:hypothetical protein